MVVYFGVTPLGGVVEVLLSLSLSLSLYYYSNEDVKIRLNKL
jgi:hypothetical protein